MFAQRKRIVRAQHHSLRSHGPHQKLQRALIEHRGVHGEPLHVLARRQLTNTVRHRMMLPGVLQSSQQKRKTSAAVRKANPQIRRQLVERSAQNHRDNSKLRLRGHANRPRHHVLRHALCTQHVPRMNEHRRAFVRAVMQETSQCRDRRDFSLQRDCQSARQDAPPACTGSVPCTTRRYLAEEPGTSDFSRPLPCAHSSSAASLNNCAQSSACSTGRSYANSTGVADRTCRSIPSRSISLSRTSGSQHAE